MARKAICLAPDRAPAVRNLPASPLPAVAQRHSEPPDASDVAGGVARIAKRLSQTKAGVQIKTTKTAKPRLVALPASPIAALEDHRREQQRWRTYFGAGYPSDLNLVFATIEGDYLRPDTDSSYVSNLCQKLGLPGSLHTLRHSHGSQLLAAGLGLPDVSRRLGHSGVWTPATIYSQALGRDEESAKAWERAPGGAQSRQGQAQ